MYLLQEIVNIVFVVLLFCTKIVKGCDDIIHQEGIVVTWFRSPITGHCLNVVPYHREWFSAVGACQARLGKLSPMNSIEETQILYDLIQNNEHLQNWTFWINASHSNASDTYFTVQRSIDQVLYIPNGVKVERKGFICEYDLMDPNKRISMDNDLSAGETFLLFMGCYIGFAMVLLSLTLGVVAVVNHRRKHKRLDRSYLD